MKQNQSALQEILTQILSMKIRRKRYLGKIWHTYSLFDLFETRSHCIALSLLDFAS